MMDHRQGIRTEVQLDVLLYSQGLPVTTGRTHNIAVGGAFIETNYKPKNGNRYVEIAFIASTDTATDIYRRKGLIVHITRNGFGLIIDNFEPERVLSTQLFEAG